MFKWMKITGLSLGTLFCATYFVFLMSEGNNAFLGFIFGMPFLVWPFVAWKWPKIGAWTILAAGAVTTWLYAIGSLFLETTIGLTGFLFLAFFPSIIISVLLFYYWHVEGI